MTRAAAYLKRRQQERPPRTGSDRLQLPWRLLEPDLIPPLAELHQSERLAFGEVGDYAPIARTISLGSNDEHVVEISSGMMQFVYGVTRVLGANSTFTEPGLEIPASISYEQSTALLLRTFEQWRNHADWNQMPPGYPRFPIQERQTWLAEKLATVVEVFMLAHELAHVATHGAPEAQGSDGESFIDIIALHMVLTAGARLNDLRMMYAGAILATRIFISLERLGLATGSGPHPAAKQRMLNLRIAAQSMLPSGGYANIATVALAYDEAMEAVDNMLTGGTRTTQQTTERVESRFRAIVEEVTRGTLTRARAITDINDAATSAPAEVLEVVAANLAAWLTDNGQAQRAAVMRSLITTMPEPARAVLSRAFRASSGPGH